MLSSEETLVNGWFRVETNEILTVELAPSLG